MSMSERELEEIEKGAQRTLDGSIYKEYQEVTVLDRAVEHASDVAYRLVPEIRRSHGEAVGLQERVGELERILRAFVRETDVWNEEMQEIIGRQPGYCWKTLEDARTALSPKPKSQEDKP